MGKKVLVVVAHPDDETIWMGGALLSNYKKWGISIISLCRKNDNDRAPKFRNVCRALNAQSFMSDLEDERLNKIPVGDVVKRIKKYAGKDYYYVFTHGKNGEYGHIRHKDVHKAVNYMIKKKMISCREVIYFAYQKKGKYAYPKKKSDKFIYISKDLLEKKKMLIRNVYGFAKNSFEDICCRGAESFSIKRVK